MTVKEELVDVKFEVNGVSITLKLVKKTYPKGVGFFHYGELDELDHKVERGNIRDAGINYTMQKGSDTTGHLNNGFYLSLNPLDSEYFGAMATRINFEAKEGISVLDFGGFDNPENKEALKALVAQRSLQISDQDLLAAHKKRELTLFEHGKSNYKTDEEIDAIVFNAKMRSDFEAKNLSTIRDAISAVGRDKVRELGCVAVMDSKTRPSWVSLVTDEPDHKIRFSRPEDYKVISKDLDWPDWNNNKGQMKDPFTLLQWILSVDVKMPLDPSVFARIDAVRNTIFKPRLTQSECEKLLSSLNNSVVSGYGSNYVRADAAREIDNYAQDQFLKQGEPYMVTPLQQEILSVVENMLNTNPQYKIPEKYEKIYNRLKTSKEQQLWPDEMDLKLHFIRNRPSKEDVFLSKFIDGMNFIDRYDYLINMADGSPNTAPWQRYDKFGENDTNLSCWRSAMAVPYMARTSKEDKYTQVKKPTEAIGEVLKIFRNRDDMHFRGHAVTGGGSFGKDGKMLTGDTSEGQGYFRATEEQVAALKTHNFIKNVEIVILDEAVGGAAFLVRYDYPDARDYEKLKVDAPMTHQSIQSEVEKELSDLIDNFKNTKGINPTKDELEELKKAAKTIVENKLAQVMPSPLAGTLDRYGKDTNDPAQVQRFFQDMIVKFALYGTERGGELADFIRDPLYANPEGFDRDKYLKENFCFSDSDCKEFDNLIKIADNGENINFDVSKLTERWEMSVKMTSKLTGELFTSLDRKDITPEQRYQRMLTLHPFFDTNGRTARAFYQLETGRPFMLNNWDSDIMMTDKALKSAVDEGNRDWVRIVGEMKREYARAKSHHPLPRTPDYYSQTQIWMRSLNIDPNKYDVSERKQITDSIMDIFKNNKEFRTMWHKKAWFDSKEIMDKALEPTFKAIHMLREEHQPVEKQQAAKKSLHIDIKAMESKPQKPSEIKFLNMYEKHKRKISDDNKSKRVLETSKVLYIHSFSDELKLKLSNELDKVNKALEDIENSFFSSRYYNYFNHGYLQGLKDIKLEIQSFHSGLDNIGKIIKNSGFDNEVDWSKNVEVIIDRHSKGALMTGDIYSLDTKELLNDAKNGLKSTILKAVNNYEVELDQKVSKEVKKQFDEDEVKSSVQVSSARGKPTI